MKMRYTKGDQNPGNNTNHIMKRRYHTLFLKMDAHKFYLDFERRIHFEMNTNFQTHKHANAYTYPTESRNWSTTFSFFLQKFSLDIMAKISLTRIPFLSFRHPLSNSYYYYQQSFNFERKSFNLKSGDVADSRTPPDLIKDGFHLVLRKKQ